MRTIIMFAVFLSLYACVQDEGKVSTDSVADDGGSTTGSTSGGTSGGTTGGSSGTPDDPLYEYQWHLNNTAQDVLSDSDYPLASHYDYDGDGIEEAGEEIDIDHNIEEAHDAGYTGAGVTIAVSDSGTDYTHGDLDDNVLVTKNRNYSFIDPTRWDLNAEAYPSGNEAHGTAVAGIIVAEGWNDIGGRGIAPDANYAAFKFVMQDSQTDHDNSNLAKTLHQLDSADDDFDIFNFSYGFNQIFYSGFEFWDLYDPDSPGSQDAILAMLEANVAVPATALRGGKGAIYVRAAGNYYDVREGDADIDDVPDFIFTGNTNASVSSATAYNIMVAAVNSDGVKASYSTPGSGVWVSGIAGEGMTDVDPTYDGQDIRYLPAIYAPDIGDCSSGYSYRAIMYQITNPFNYSYSSLNSSCDHTNIMNGTSAAAPMVSGVVALMLEANPNLTWRDVKYILAMTAQPIDYYPVASFPGSIWSNDIPHPETTTQISLAADGYVWDQKWIVNGAGVTFSNWYGFGLVKADDAVAMAETHVNLGTYRTSLHAANTNAVPLVLTDGDVTSPVSNTINVIDNYKIEAIEVIINTTHPEPGELAIHLKGPNGLHVSRLLNLSSGTVNVFGETKLQLLTNAFFEETSAGVWTLEVYDDSLGNTGSITSWSMKIHGRDP